jgi:hypothetical protein
MVALRESTQYVLQWDAHYRYTTVVSHEVQVTVYGTWEYSTYISDETQYLVP